MVSDGQGYMFLAPWLVIFPGLMILLTVLAFNLISDGLRDALDPRHRSLVQRVVGGFSAGGQALGSRTRTTAEAESA
jgi:peptide/nickel transport system permease protein